MASLGELFVKVGADVSAFKTSMTEVNTSLKALDKDAKASTAGIAAMGQRLTSVGMGLTAAITLPLVGAGAASMKFYGDFEQTMNRVSALGDITGASLSRLGGLAMQLGADTKFSAQEAAAGMAELAAKGYNANQIYQAMPGIMSLAATENMSVGDAAKIASSALVQFNLDSSNTTHIADTLALASKESASSVQTLGLSMEYVGPIAHSAGMSFEETAAALAILSNAGLEGERAGTGMRGVLGSLINPSTDAAKSLEQLGVKTTDATGAMRPFPQILTDLKDAGMSTQDAFNIFGREAATAALVLTEKGGPALAEFTTKLIQSDGEAKKTADTMQRGFKGAMEQLRGSVETAGIAMGSILAPSITSLVNLVKSAADGLATFAQWFQTLPAPIQNAAVAVLALAAAIGPVLLIAGQLMTSWAALAPMWAGLATAASSLGISIGAGLGATLTSLLPIVGYIAAAFAAWKLAEWAYANVKPFHDLVFMIGGVLSSTASIIKDVFIIAFDLIKVAIIGAYGAGKWFVDFVMGIPVLGDIITGFSQAFSGGFDLIRTAFGWLAEKVNWLKDALHGFANNEAPESIEASSKLKVGADGLAIAYKDWESQSKRTSAATKEHAAATRESAEAQKLAEQEARALSAQNEMMTNNLRAARTEALASNTTWLAMALAVKDVADRKAYLIQNIARLKYEIAGGNTSIAAMNALLTETERITAEFTATAGNVPTVVIPAWLQLEAQMASAVAGVQKVDAAYSTLGVNSSAVILKKKADAVAAYTAIKDSGTASAADIQAAYEAMVGIVNSKNGELTTQTVSTWDTFSKSVSTVITNLSQDIVKSLFEGEMSWKEKGINALKSLGEAVLNVFVEPATAALTGFMTGILKDLFGGNGFGGLGSILDTVAGKLKGIFGGAAEAAGGAAGNAAGAAGGAAGAAGQIAGAAVSSVVGAVAGVVGAVSGVIGNFQNAKMETTLNAIEWNTRKSSLHFEHAIDQLLWPFLPRLSDINDRINEYLVEWRELRDAVVYATQSKLDALINITSTAMYGAILRTNEILETRLPNLNAGGEGGMSVVLKVDGRELARAMVNYLDDAGATI